MSSSDHSELYSTLSELWTLLDTLAALPPNMVILPPADTGIHPPSEFNADSARAGGFTKEATTVLASLPYLQYPLEIRPSTSSRCFLGAELDGRDFEETREMTEDEPIAGSAIVLTESLAGVGCYYVYDTEKKVVYPYTPQDEPDDGKYYDVPAMSPREAFQPLIDKYRGLHYTSRPSNAKEGEYQLIIDEWDVCVPDNAPVRARQLTEELHRRWQYSRGLEEIYLECGWRPDQVDQSAFRRDEFLEKRRRYLFD